MNDDPETATANLRLVRRDRTRRQPAKKQIKALLAKLKKSWSGLPDIVKLDVSPRSGLTSLMAPPQTRTKKENRQRNYIRGCFGSMGSIQRK